MMIPSTVPQRSRRILAAVAWLLFALAAAVNIWLVTRQATPLGMPWRESTGALLDYRDIVVSPGRWLWAGNNPYDPDTYLAAHPWAQEFDPYAPSWLVATAWLCWLPVATGGAIYLGVGSLFMALTARRLALAVTTRHSDLLAPAAAIWMLIWYPTRTLGSSFLISCATVFLLLDRSRESHPWKAGFLLSITLMKPQIGLVLTLLLLAHKEWRTVWRGWVIMWVWSLPALTICLVDAGGLMGYVDSLRRDIAYANSPAAAIDFLSAESYRIDLPGMFARGTGIEPSGPLQLAIALLVLVPAAVTLWRRPRSMATVPLVIAPMLLASIHVNYDLTFWPVVAADAMALAVARRDRLSTALAVCATLVVVHLHRISTGLLGLSRYTADAVDVALVVTSLVLAIIIAWRQPRTCPSRSHPEPDEARD